MMTTSKRNGAIFVCGVCGTVDQSDEYAFCMKCHSDFWIEKDDVDNPELDTYVRRAIDNLKITKSELREKFI